MPFKFQFFRVRINMRVAYLFPLLIILILIFHIAYDSISDLYNGHRLRNKISTMYMDADSVRVKNTFFSENGSWCGMVDAKNRYGDYTGNRMFVLTKSGVFMSDEMTKPACIGFPDGSQLESAQCDADRIKAFDRTTGFKDVFLNFYSKNCKKEILL